MEITLRPVTEPELPAFYRADSAAFGDFASQQDIEEWRWALGLDLARSIAAFDGDHIVGAAAALDFELTVPGPLSIPCAGITMVGVLPTHRRRGILTRMMRMQLDDVVARGEPVAALLASEAEIYGRFGYGAASFAASWQLPTEGTRFSFPPPTGRLRLLDDAEAAAVVPGLYERARRHIVGEVTRAPELWKHELERPLGNTGKRPFTVVHESDSGEPDGFARYRVEESSTHGRPDSTVHIVDLYAHDPAAEAALFEFLVSVDLVGTVRAGSRPLDDPLRWRLADPRRLQTTQVIDKLWVRIAEPQAALGARRYAVDDRIVVELADAFLPANAGRFVVEGSPDSARAARTDEPADLSMSVNELGSLYLGGVTATALARAGRILELRPGAIGRADRFFTVAPAPWSGSHF